MTVGSPWVFAGAHEHSCNNHDDMCGWVVHKSTSVPKIMPWDTEKGMRMILKLYTFSDTNP